MHREQQVILLLFHRAVNSLSLQLQFINTPYCTRKSHHHLTGLLINISDFFQLLLPESNIFQKFVSVI
jgi:hypothetical protein